MGIKDSEKCEDCGEKDHIEHYFFNCEKIKKLWPEISQIIRITTNVNLTLNEQTVILGIEQDNSYNVLTKREIKYINNLFLIGKLSIIKCKIEKIDVTLCFEKELRVRKIEKNYDH